MKIVEHWKLQSPALPIHTIHTHAHTYTHTCITHTYIHTRTSHITNTYTTHTYITHKHHTHHVSAGCIHPQGCRVSFALLSLKFLNIHASIYVRVCCVCMYVCSVWVCAKTKHKNHTTTLRNLSINQYFRNALMRCVRVRACVRVCVWLCVCVCVFVRMYLCNPFTSCINDACDSISATRSQQRTIIVQWYRGNSSLMLFVSSYSCIHGVCVYAYVYVCVGMCVVCVCGDKFYLVKFVSHTYLTHISDTHLTHTSHIHHSHTHITLFTYTYTHIAHLCCSDFFLTSHKLNTFSSNPA